MSRTSTLLFSVALFASLASADTIQLTLTGTVNSSNLTAVSAGQAVTITLTYDSSVATQSVQNHQGFFADAMTSISIDAGPNYSSSYSGLFGQIDQYDNLGNTDGIQFEAAASPSTYQYSSAHGVSLSPIVSGSSTGAFSYALINLGSNGQALWSGYALPTSYTFSDFDQTRNFGFAFNIGSFGGGFTQLSAVNLTTSATPEPSTWALAGVSLMGLAGWRVRRRA
jgi:MYXO-CTERM domain-containing protein